MHTRTLILALAAAALTSASALDLTPKRTAKEREGGFKIPVLQFTHEGKGVEYCPPLDWEIAGGGASLTLTPTDIPQASAKMSVVKRDAKSGSVASADESLEKWIRDRFLPEDALDIERAEVLESPYLLGELPSRDYHFRFRRSTSPFMKSISVVDLNERERLVVEISAASAHFETAWSALIRSMFSWEWME